MQDREIRAPGLFVAHRCLACGSVYVVNPPAPLELRSHYPESYQKQVVEPVVGSRRILSRVVGALSRRRVRVAYSGVPVPPELPAGARVLDLGYGAGNLLAQLRPFGFRLCGLDFSKSRPGNSEITEFASLVRGDTGSPPFSSGTFDCIISSHNLEHLHSPASALVRYQDLLRPGGQLILATPNAMSPLAGAFREDWYGGASGIPRHLVILSSMGLRALAEAAGFVSIEIETVLSPAAGASILLRLGVDYPRVRRNRVVQLLGLPLDLAFWFIGRGQNLLVFAKRA